MAHSDLKLRFEMERARLKQELVDLEKMRIIYLRALAALDGNAAKPEAESRQL